MLDKLDKKILYELEINANIAYSKLAKLVRSSKEVVRYRIQRLEKQGILLSKGSIIDMSKLGYTTFRVYLKWQHITLEKKQECYDYLSSQESVWTIATLHGKWDMAFFFGAKSGQVVTAFHDLWNAFLNKYKQYIADSRIAIYSPIHNFNKRFFMEGPCKVIERIYGEEKEVSLNALDLKILDCYMQKPMNFVELAKKLKVSVETIRKHVKKLETEGVIIGYKIDLDLDKLGFQGYRVDFTLRSTKRKKELYQYIKQNKYFYQVNFSIGGADFETEVVVRNLQHLLELLEDIMSRFSEDIKHYEYFGYSLFPKLTTIPD